MAKPTKLKASPSPRELLERARDGMRSDLETLTRECDDLATRLQKRMADKKQLEHELAHAEAALLPPSAAARVPKEPPANDDAEFWESKADEVFGEPPNRLVNDVDPDDPIFGGKL